MTSLISPGNSEPIRAVREVEYKVNEGDIPNRIHGSEVLGVDEVDTLSYEDLADSVYYFWTIPNTTDDHYYNVRFSPPLQRFGIVGVLIPLFDIPPRLGGPIGEPNLKVVIFESGANADGEPGYPSEAIDSIIVPYQRLTFAGYNPLVWNWVNLLPLRIIFYDSIDFHIGVDMVGREGEHDTLAIFSDRGRRRPSDRSGVWSGPDSTWFKMINLPGIERGVNFFVRAVISSEDSVVYVADPAPHGQFSRLTPLKVYPNPFNTTTTINFLMSQPGLYKIELLDLQGRPSGWYLQGWGEQEVKASLSFPYLPNGTYLLKLTTPADHQATRVIMLK